VGTASAAGVVGWGNYRGVRAAGPLPLALIGRCSEQPCSRSVGGRVVPMLDWVMADTGGTAVWCSAVQRSLLNGRSAWCNSATARIVQERVMVSCFRRHTSWCAMCNATISMHRLLPAVLVGGLLLVGCLQGSKF